MIHQFQVIYRTGPSGPLAALEFAVDSSLRSASQAAAELVPGVDVVSLSRLGARLREGQKWFKREEAATYCGIDVSTLDLAVMRGDLRRGSPWSAEELDAWIHSEAVRRAAA